MRYSTEKSVWGSTSAVARAYQQACTETRQVYQHAAQEPGRTINSSTGLMLQRLLEDRTRAERVEELPNDSNPKPSKPPRI